MMTHPNPLDFKNRATILVFVFGGILRAIFGHFLGDGIVGAIAGFIAWTIGGALLIGIVVAFIAFNLSLLAQHFPPGGDNPDKLSERPMIL